jgi:hypothetical protein
MIVITIEEFRFSLRQRNASNASNYDQVSFYFEPNNLFHPCQHGLRKNYSCESALHKIISEFNEAKHHCLKESLP